MNYKMYIIGGIIYVILAIILGMIGGTIGAFAVLIAALIAGIYVGMKAASPMGAVVNGVISGLIGGIIAGVIAPFFVIPGTTGFPLLDTFAIMLGTTIGSYVTILAGFGFFIGAGIILGAIGGFIGKKIKK